MKSNDEDSIPALLLVVLLLPITAVIYAFVLRELWTWFVVPLGAPAVSMAHAYGLSLLARSSVWTGPETKKDDRENKSPLAQAVGAVIFPLVAWGFGAIAHALM